MFILKECPFFIPLLAGDWRSGRQEERVLEGNAGRCVRASNGTGHVSNRGEHAAAEQGAAAVAAAVALFHVVGHLLARPRPGQPVLVAVHCEGPADPTQRRLIVSKVNVILKKNPFPRTEREFSCIEPSSAVTSSPRL